MIPLRQGNDAGTQYRSGICATPDQKPIAETSRQTYGKALALRGLDTITIEFVDQGPFYFAEENHQQYLATGYCSLGGNGVCWRIGVGVATEQP